MNTCKTIAVIFIIVSPVILAGQEDTVKQKPVELHGYIKDLQTVSFVDKVDSLASLNLLHNRLNFKINLSENFSARLELRNRIFYGDQLKQMPGFGKSINKYNGVLDLSKLWVNEQTLVVHSVADRLLLQYASGNWDIKLGRQRINWGINNVWNPNDIFNAYNFLDFDYEERQGNDALRLQHFFANNTSLDLAYKPGKHEDEAIAAILYKFNKRKYDYQLLGSVYYQDLVLGAGWAGSIKNAGFKGELSYFHPKKNGMDTTGTVSFSVMTDQTFKNDWYVSVAALYNSDPTNVFESGGGVYSADLSAKRLFPYRFTGYVNVLKTFSPVSTLNLSLIYSPEKNSLILFPAYAWNIARNFDLDITAQSFFARTGHRYTTQGTSLYLRGKWSF